MMRMLIVFSMLTTAAFASDCNDLYKNRGLDLQTTQDAFSCLKNTNQTQTDKYQKAIIFNKMAYLKFFEASFYENDSVKALYDSFTHAKDAIEQYGPVFNRDAVKDLPNKQIEEIALSYYIYGTSVSKYVELMGKWEAVKRMSEIKNTMKMILSLKKPETFHYGAYRTLAIFNLKVPKIAGGNIQRAKMFFEKLMKESMTSLNVASYPVGHIYYAEYFWKTGQNEKACKELDLVRNLTDEQIETYFRDIIHETKKDREVAQEIFEIYSC